jgi:pimeloyl-ACP methyl ester carboxylesterase
MESMKPHFIIIPSPLILGRTYKRLARELQETFSVRIMNLPNTGYRRSVSKTLNADDYAEFIREEIKALQVKGKVIVFGHSNSGVIAAKISLKEPDLISGVILADTTGLKSYSYFSVILRRGLDGVLEMKFSLWAIFHLMINVFFHPLNFLKQIHLSVKNDIPDEFSRIKVPTLILWGKRDHTMPLADGRMLHSLIPDSEIYISQKGSHDWVLTHPHEAAGMVKVKHGHLF